MAAIIAEKRIDHDACPVERRWGRRLRRSGPALRRRGGVAFELVQRANQKHPHRIAACGQDAGGDKPIAPIIAGTGDDDDAASQGMPRDDVGDRTSGILHQRHSSDAAGDRTPVGFGHLGSAEQFDHAADTTDRSQGSQCVDNRHFPSPQEWSKGRCVENRHGAQKLIERLHRCQSRGLVEPFKALKRWKFFRH
jgi:hypothetical protein